MDDLRRHVLVVQDVVHRGALGHKDHEQGDIAPGVGEQQGGGHGAHGGPAHVDAGLGGLLPVQVGALLHHLVDGGGDIHGQVHHRARGPDEDGGHKDLGQVQVGVARVQQALRVAHHRPVDLEQVGEQDAQHAGDQDAQKGPGHRRPAPPVKAVHQGDDDEGEEQGDGQPHPDGVPALQVQGDQHLPQGEHRQGEGGDGPDAGAPGKQNQEHCEAHRHQGLPAQAVVVGHGHVGDGVPVVAHHHLGHIPWSEDLVLLQRTVKHVDSGDGLPGEGSVQNFQLAALLTGADQAGVNNGGVVHRQHLGLAALRLLVEKGPLKAGGQEDQNENGQQAHQHRGVVAQGLGGQTVSHVS